MEKIKGGLYEMNTQRLLGKGSFGEVFHGIYTENKGEVAIKRINKGLVQKHGNKLLESIHNEVKTLTLITKIHNPFLIKIYDTFEDNDYIYIILEFCNQGTLLDFLNKYKRLEEKQALEIFYSIVLGLSALDCAGIVHRDMKPENIFINQGVYKIGDFGFASQAKKFMSNLGTTMYMAPEFYTGAPKDGRVDTWAMGLILYEMIFGRHAFEGENLVET